MRAAPRFLLRLVPLLAIAFLCGGEPARAQVSPAEIRTPELKELEQTYMKQLMEMNRQVSKTKFAFPLVLTRYVGLDPQEQSGSDTRGLEFVRFHERNILKVSASYNAAFRADRLTQNQRANRVLDDVIVPILRLLPEYFPADVPFDGFGFEISYHVRAAAAHSDFEGKEILVVVLAKEDAFRYAKAESEAAHQQILNFSEVYVSGQDFGLALGKSVPLSLEPADKRRPAKEALPAEKEATAAPASRTAPASGISPRLSLGIQMPARVATSAPGSVSMPAQPAAQAPPLTQADADALQKQYQSELDAMAKEGAAKFHLTEYAPPSLVVFRNQLYLQVSLRNPASFDKEKTSIYKRAAQSFDLFLAPLLKDLLAKTPSMPGLAGLDITVLNQFASGPSTKTASEAVEYICPLGELRRFTEYEITNQQLLEQSIILVNGVRIALNLQQVE
jgi:hypothetical protein